MAVVVVVSLLGGGSAASGYVVNTTSSGAPIRWYGRKCIFMHINISGSDDIKNGSDVTAAKMAMENWRRAVRHCSYIQFVPIESVDARPEVRKDGQNENVIYWEEKNWTHDPAMVALTVSFYVDRPDGWSDGRLLDADIVLNGHDFHFATTGQPDRTDVQNVVTHELGHLLGLDHPCYDGAVVPRPRDHNGDPVPDCNSADVAAMKETTMFNIAEQGETKKRTPEPDDIKGICDTYPLSADPGVCSESGTPALSGGCSLGGTGAGPVRLFPVLVALLLVIPRGAGSTTPRGADEGEA